MCNNIRWNIIFDFLISLKVFFYIYFRLIKFIFICIVVLVVSELPPVF